MATLKSKKKIDYGRVVYDGRTAEGRMQRRAYLDGFEGRPIAAAERDLPSWEIYEDSYAQGRVDRDRHDRLS